MKNHMFALCLSLFALSCGPKSSVSPKSLDASTKISMGKDGFRDLGWVKYAGGGWMETSSPYIAVLGAERLRRNDGKCEDGKLAFKRTSVLKITEDGYPLSKDALGEELAKQHVAGLASGIIVREGDRSFLVTAKHAEGDVGEFAILNYSLENAQKWEKDGVLCVPSDNAIRIPRCVLTDVDVLVCELNGGSGGLHLTHDDVNPGVVIHTRIHPFGLPMKTSKVTVSSCDANQCWARFDNATGGSGGGVVTENEELVGLVVGKHARSRVEGKSWVPCQCYPGGNCYNSGGAENCKKGEPFIPSRTIRNAINNREGKSDAEQ